MLNTVSKPWEPPPEKQRRCRSKKKFDLIGLPNEILLTVFGYLDVFDSATLALTCKRMAGLACNYSQLDVPGDAAGGHGRRPCGEGHFLKRRLGDGFFPKRLRYCWGCRHYVPRRKSYWTRKIGKKGWQGRGGPNLGRLTPAQCWALPESQHILARWDKGAAVKKCPRCKICRKP